MPLRASPSSLIASTLAVPQKISVERPTRFELVVNLTTAKALGLTIPQSLRADDLVR